MDELDFKQLLARTKERVSITDIINLYNVRQSADNPYKYHCPFHGEDDVASASVKTGYFKCFTCGKVFDVVGFVAQYENCSMFKALKILDSKFNLGLFKDLTEEEKENYQKREIQRLQELHQKQEKEKQLNIATTILAKSIRFIDNAKYDLRMSFENYINNNWKFGNIWFMLEKQQMQNNWLYDVLVQNSSIKDNGEYEAQFGNNRFVIAEKIINGDIKIL